MDEIVLHVHGRCVCVAGGRPVGGGVVQVWGWGKCGAGASVGLG